MAPTEPIPIQTSSRRPRSVSVSSISSGSASSSPEVSTPSSQPSFSPSTSPIMTYLAAQSQKSPGAATFPFRRPWPAHPVFEEEEEEDGPLHAQHVRRASYQTAGRLAQVQIQPSTSPDTKGDRGTGLLRRLSLSGSSIIKPLMERSSSPPNAPPNSAVTPTQSAPRTPLAKTRGPRRSATISVEKPARAPSPMGERILKGHFDGFN